MQIVRSSRLCYLIRGPAISRGIGHNLLNWILVLCPFLPVQKEMWAPLGCRSDYLKRGSGLLQNSRSLRDWLRPTRQHGLIGTFQLYV